MQPLSIIRLFETTKDQRSSFVVQIIDKLESGNADPLETHLQVKCMEETIKQITSNDTYKNYVLEAAQKEGKSFAFHNAKFEVKETGVKYDYSKCADPEYAELAAKMETLKEQVKAREAFLKTVPVSGMDIITTDGEAVKVYPPSKTSTTSVAVTLK